jgi:hypothetical protein
VDPGFFAAEGEAGCFGLEALACADRFGERFARSAAAFFGAGFVNFVGALGGVGQNQNLVAGDLQEAAADGHRFFGTALFDAHHAWHQGGQQWRVARQDAHDAFGAGRHHHIDCLFGIHFAFGGYDLHS